MFAINNKNDQLKVTDLHQGIVWRTQTSETRLSEDLINRFDYDSDYGSVLSMFYLGSLGYPFTLHFTVMQTRAFIHIQYTTRCEEIAINNPTEKGEQVKILNQIIETNIVRNLANGS